MSTGQVDFDFPPTFLITLSIAAMQPVYLLAAARIAGLRERPGTQFLCSIAVMLVLWLASVFHIARVHPIGPADIVLDLMMLCSATLFYLEVWSLMLRGYTLGILLTLLKAGRPLNETEIYEAYHGGDGVDWIMRHRLGGLVAAGLVRKQDGQLTLTPLKGILVARLYQLSGAVLGLRRHQ